MGYDAQVAQGVMQIENLLGSVPGLPSRPPQQQQMGGMEQQQQYGGDPQISGGLALQQQQMMMMQQHNGAAGPSEASEVAVPPDQYICLITAEIMTDPVNTVRLSLP